METNFFLQGPVRTGKSTFLRAALGDDLSRCGGFAVQRILASDSDKPWGYRVGSPGEFSVELHLPFPGTVLSEHVRIHPEEDRADLILPGEWIRDAGTRRNPPAAAWHSDNPPIAAGHSNNLLIAADSSGTDGSEEMILSHLFRFTGRDGKSRSLPQVFEAFALPALQRASEPEEPGAPSYPLILLDEIGGVELFSDSIYTAILDLLKSDVPCLGVWKWRPNLEKMAAGFRSNADLLCSRADRIRQFLEQDDSSRLLLWTGETQTDGHSTGGVNIRQELLRFLKDLPENSFSGSMR